MIYSLYGKIIQKGENFVVLEINQVGYQIFVTDFLLEKIKNSDQIKLFTYLYLREETIELYGFAELSELECFKQLNAVPGIGPKIAINVLSLVKIGDLKKAIQLENMELLTKVSGIGKKTAQRIIMEMKGKLEKIGGEAGDQSSLEAIEALTKLGYPLNKAREVIKMIPEEIKGTKNKLKEALKILGKS